MAILINEKELKHILLGCLNNERASQQALYKCYYGFAMAICLRYAGSRFDAADILNEGFLKVFMQLNKYNTQIPFPAWLGKIMVNTSIDYYRSRLRFANTQDLSKADDISEEDTIQKKLAYEDLLSMIQKLPTSYRTVFNLFAIDGYSHNEIALLLGISAGTSKSNLFKARQKLKELIDDVNKQENQPVNKVPIIPIQGPEGNDIILNESISDERKHR